MTRYLLALLLASGIAMAAPTSPRAPSAPIIDLMSNGSFEGLKAGWTASSGSTFTIDTSAPLNGNASAVFTPTASGQSVSSAQYVVKEGLKSAACAATFKYKSSEATNLLTAEVVDGSANVLQSIALASPASAARKTSISFICPSSGTIGVKLVSTGAASGTKVDDFTLGTNDLVQVSQASYVGGLTVLDGCSFSTNATSGMVDMTTSACAGSTLSGLASSFSTGNGSVTFNSIPPGHYRGVWKGSCVKAVSDSQGARFSMTDGTTYSPTYTIVSQSSAGGSGATEVFSPCLLETEFDYSSAGSHTFKIQGSEDTSAAAGEVAFSSPVSAEIFSLYRYPTTSEIATQTTTQAATWSGSITGAHWDTTSGSMADLTVSGTPVLTESGNVNFGTVSLSSTLPGILWAPQAGRTYSIDFSSTANMGTSGQNALLNLTDGTTIIASQLTSALVETPLGLHGHYKALNNSPVNLRVQARTSSGADVLYGSATGDTVVNITINDITQPGPQLVLPGNVQTTSGGQERIERAHITLPSGGPYLVLDQTPGFLTVANGGTLASASTGLVTPVFNTGVFSSEPTCTVTVYYGNVAARTCYIHTIPSATGTDIQCVDSGAGTAIEGIDVGLICVGPK